MKHSLNFSIGIVFVALMLTVSMGAQAVVATGVVFNDKNTNGVLDKGEKGIAKVRVSNGREVVVTDRKGRYELPVDEDTILFVIKPSGWMTPVNEMQLPQFYYIHKPNGSPKLKHPGVAPTGPLPESVNFPLMKMKEGDAFKSLMFGDTQTTNQKEIDYLAHDILEELTGTDAKFGVTLGDVVNNDLSMAVPLAKAVATVGIPWYNVLGNHDENYDAPNDALSDEHWERIYGPPTYAFEYGDIHFIPLDNVFWEGDRYHAELTDEQLEFLKNDLSFVDTEDQLVVIMMHIPLQQIRNKEAFFDVIKNHKVISLSAHFHTQRHMFLDEEDGWPAEEPHHHMIHGTACGSWWNGLKDVRGIPHTTMADGVPNGYSIFHFDEDTYRIEYKAASLPASYQMAIHLPEAIAQADLSTTEVLVNVFNGSERSTTAMQVDGEGEWLPLTNCDAQDPGFVAKKAFEDALPKGSAGKLPKPSMQNHFWKGMLPAGISVGSHKLYVKTIDMHGQTYTNTRIFRVE